MLLILMVKLVLTMLYWIKFLSFPWFWDEKAGFLLFLGKNYLHKSAILLFGNLGLGFSTHIVTDHRFYQEMVIDGRIALRWSYVPWCKNLETMLQLFAR